MQKTLAIALCDTNFADRKQMERLLERESDKRLDSCVFYMDTYGNKEALLSNPRIYDAYFLDMPDMNYSAYDLAKDIRLKDIVSPIVFCNSTLDYHTLGRELPNTFYMDKPILVADLSTVLDAIIEQKSANHIPSVEVRNRSEVHYLTEKEIVYCESHGHSRIMTIHLQDGTIVEGENFLDNFITELEPLGHFFMANKNTLVNARYVTKVGIFHVTLQSGETFKLHKIKRNIIEKLVASVDN